MFKVVPYYFYYMCVNIHVPYVYIVSLAHPGISRSDFQENLTLMKILADRKYPSRST